MKAKLKNIYRRKLREQDGLAIWIVDGATIRSLLYTDFVMGGTEARYAFIPKNEVWIDNAISGEEMEYTITHEIEERKLMMEAKLSYGDAHDKAVEVEQKMRKKDIAEVKEHEEKLGEVENKIYETYGN